MTIEDRLRATTEAVTEAMRPVRPLDLTSSQAGDSAPARRPGLRPRRWPGWLIPLTAAVAVIGVAATLVAVRDIPGSHPAPPVTPAASATSTSASTPPPSAVPVVPRYYVTLSAESRVPVRDAIVADASTGKQIDVVKPPSDAEAWCTNGIVGDMSRRFSAQDRGTNTKLRQFKVVAAAKQR